MTNFVINRNNQIAESVANRGHYMPNDLFHVINPTKMRAKFFTYTLANEGSVTIQIVEIDIYVVAISYLLSVYISCREIVV